MDMNMLVDEIHLIRHETIFYQLILTKLFLNTELDVRYLD